MPSGRLASTPSSPRRSFAAQARNFRCCPNSGHFLFLSSGQNRIRPWSRRNTELARTALQPQSNVNAGWGGVAVAQVPLIHYATWRCSAGGSFRKPACAGLRSLTDGRGPLSAGSPRHPSSVSSEFAYPVQSNFFATVAIGLLLQSAFNHYSPLLSPSVWITAAAVWVVVAVGPV